jgi:outer membrane protein
MIKKLPKIIIFFFVLFYSNFSNANDKISYLDIDYIMNNSLAGKSINDQLKIKHQSNLENFKKTENKLKEEEKKIISQKNVLSKDEFEKKVTLHKKNISDYREKRNKASKDLTKKKIDSQSLLLSELTPILAEYSKSNSISMIMPKKNIIMGKTNLDITNQVLKILDKKIKNIKIK